MFLMYASIRLKDSVTQSLLLGGIHCLSVPENVAEELSDASKFMLELDWRRFCSIELPALYNELTD